MLKNIMPYRLLEPFALSADALEEQLTKVAFMPCGPIDMQSRGWAPVVPGAESLIHDGNGCYLLRLRREDKIMPASVVRDFVNERAAEREEQEMRTVRRREREQIKEEVIFELLPRAFTRKSDTLVLIDPVGGWLIVDASGWRQAEEATEFLRDTLGSLPIAPPATRDAPQSVMSDWLMRDLPAAIEVGEAAVLEDPSTEGGVVTLKRQDLFSDEALAHLKAGLRVRRLAVSWAERISCTLDADYAIRQFKLSDLALESGDREPESAAEQFDADFTLLALEIRGFLAALMELWGGDANAPAQVDPFATLKETKVAVNGGTVVEFPQPLSGVVRAHWNHPNLANLLTPTPGSAGAVDGLLVRLDVNHERYDGGPAERDAWYDPATKSFICLATASVLPNVVGWLKVA